MGLFSKRPKVQLGPASDAPSTPTPPPRKMQHSKGSGNGDANPASAVNGAAVKGANGDAHPHPHTNGTADVNAHAHAHAHGREPEHEHERQAVEKEVRYNAANTTSVDMGPGHAPLDSGVAKKGLGGFGGQRSTANKEQKNEVNYIVENADGEEDNNSLKSFKSPLPPGELERILSDDQELNLSFVDRKRNVDALAPGQVSVAIPSSGLIENLDHLHSSHSHKHKHTGAASLDPSRDRLGSGQMATVHSETSTSTSSNSTTIPKQAQFDERGYASDDQLQQDTVVTTFPSHRDSKNQHRQHERLLPPAAEGRDDPSARETAEQQEGAAGRGRGQHEARLSPSLVEGQDGDYSFQFPFHSGAVAELRDRPSTPGTPRDLQDRWDRLHHHQPRDDHGRQEEPDHTLADELKDELGRLPPTFPAIKGEEEPPGAHHGIVLEPRLVHTQFDTSPPTPPNVARDTSDTSARSPAGDIITTPSVTITPTSPIAANDERAHQQNNMPNATYAHITPRASNDAKLKAADVKGKSKGKGKEKERVVDEEERLQSRPTSRAASLKDMGLGVVPPGDDDGDWDDEDDANSEFRSALQSGTTTPLSHPADPRGEHGYWSTFRPEDVAPVGESSTPHMHAHSPKAPGSARGSLVNFSLNTPVRANTGLPPTGTDENAPPSVVAKSGKMRNAMRFTSKILPHRHGTVSVPQKEPEAAEVPVPTMTNEMLAGTLPVMILKTWLDRDEDGHRAVPVLLGNLRFRIGDSVGLRQGGRHTGREMFKIECEYGDGAIKWVVYRELRDFLMLHAHYKAANLGTRMTGLRSSRRVEMPEFPRNSLPYWAREKADKVDADAAKEKVKDKLGASTSSDKVGHFGPATRAALQQYLIDLIRAVLFRPESNRLCIFFELSALTVALAPRGGFQGKAGFLKILSSKASRRSNHPGILPSTWRQHRSPKWFIVRESYFVSTDGPQETDIYDVFIIDPDFSIERPKRAYRKGLHLISGSGHKHGKHGEGSHDLELVDDEDNKDTSQHTFYISNAQRRIKLVAKNARQMHQFIVSMERVAFQCLWTGRNRFDSFAPVRMNVAAQWLVDGRDYFWNLSRAINMARSRIYIHDWWISPEIYLRRPGDEKYRLDNLLKRKAEEGVRIFIILYNEVSAKTTPVESLYAKRTLVGLHPNIMVQRSPSHLPSGALYWSHHEKLCVIDEMIAFMGGLDLCFGRWDTSQHILTDEDHTAPDGPDGPVWIGKDYWNERVAEFHDLDKPYEDAFDRSKTPRMPWHDVGLQLVGQPARDICRHFCQRWNYLLRIKNHTRKMPFLLPPADFTERELIDLKLQGTCEVQICRSVGPWSMGTLTKIEHSIQNAYIKSIQLSEHFVYIENQFFITSTVVDTTRIENRIGDALVQRIIRAHKEGQKWRACIVIPLLPGYTHPIDTAEASSVRLILECQNRTICRGTHSIFTRLKKEGINPDDYISFFSLRGWAKFKSGALTTEQVYIHGKTMIVDDRLVLCGSANINERSQRGDRDSELLAVVRDTDMIDGTMAGKPFKVGRYAHTLRMRLMREHVGVDVDAIAEDELMLRKPLAEVSDIALWDPDNEQTESHKRGITRVKRSTARERLNKSVSTAMGSIAKGIGENVKRDVVEIKEKIIHPIDTIEGKVASPPDEIGPDRQDVGPDGKIVTGFASSVVPTLEEVAMMDRRPDPDSMHMNGAPLAGVDLSRIPSATGDLDHGQRPKEEVVRRSPEHIEHHKMGAPASAPQADDAQQRPSDELFPGEDNEDARKARRMLRKHLSSKVTSSPWTMPTPTPKIDPNRFHDPLDDKFWNDMWVAVAVHNTQIYRKVFRCVPDDMVTSWADYKAFANHMDKFGRTEESKSEDVKITHDAGGSGGGVVGPAGQDTSKPQTSETVDGFVNEGKRSHESHQVVDHERLAPESTARAKSRSRSNTATSQNVPKLEPLSATSTHEERKPSGENEAWAQWELDEMETLLNEVRGHLVLYSTRFLEAEDLANNFLFNQERILPLVIYD